MDSTDPERLPLRIRSLISPFLLHVSSSSISSSTCKPPIFTSHTYTNREDSMSHLHRSAGGFFAFHLFTYVAYLSMQGFFRTLGLLCTNFDSAFRVATFFVPNMISYAGYTIPVFDLKRWLFWIAYINPLYYGEFLWS